MPHDSKGRKIEAGDYVIGTAWFKGGKTDVFKVAGVSESSETCNVNALPFYAQIQCTSLNAKETELVLKADGSKPE